ncbi:Phosphopantothenate-cysteine ligase [Smittium culicis]|uniref:Phosphopantothenate-cysteine ligase n=1 Tax=Smittium culicis TaxID=133412 RepID=A0A1R1Y1L7_9FUNG|nr:Phosphopantothenate-cysteine ligase [Smittium culicis]
MSDSRLFMPTFISLTDYLFGLRAISELLQKMNKNVIAYLASAVSDFYIPADKLAEHKIQSSDGQLTLVLKQVPKFLGNLTNEWMPKAFVISFKLETDESILESKAIRSLDSYGHHAVIANMLHTRKEVVWIISNKDRKSTEIRLTPQQLSENFEIEELIIQYIISLHNNYLSEN